MIDIERKPKTYRERVNWYVSEPGRKATLFNTKSEATTHARFLNCDGVSVGWIPKNANARTAIFSDLCGSFSIEDRR